MFSSWAGSTSGPGTLRTGATLRSPTHCLRPYERSSLYSLATWGPSPTALASEQWETPLGEICFSPFSILTADFFSYYFSFSISFFVSPVLLHLFFSYVYCPRFLPLHFTFCTFFSHLLFSNRFILHFIFFNLLFLSPSLLKHVSCLFLVRIST